MTLPVQYQAVFDQYFSMTPDSQKQALITQFLASSTYNANPATQADAQQSLFNFVDSIFSNTPYATVFNQLFDQLSTSDQEIAFRKFVDSNYFTLTPQNSQDVSNLVNAFLENVYGSDGFTQDPPQSGIYSQLMHSFFASTNSDDSVRVDQIIHDKILWNMFLQQYGYTTAPSNTDTVAITQFTQFLQLMFSQSVNDTTPQLSPLEVQKRILLSKTFDALLGMLEQLQNTIYTQSNALIYYGNLQENDTSLLTRVPVYVPNSATATSDTQQPADPRNTMTLDPTQLGTLSASDLGTITIGYNSISLEEVVAYMATAPNPATGQSVDFSFTNSSTNAPDSMTIDFSTKNVNGALVPSVNLTYYNPDGTPQVLSITNPNQRFQFTGTGSNGSSPPFTLSQLPDAGPTQPPIDLTNLTASQRVDTFNSLLLTALNNTTGLNNVFTDTQNVIGALPNIPWRLNQVQLLTQPGLTGTDLQNDQIQKQQDENVAVQNRGETNALLQQYVATARAYRTTAQQNAQGIQGSLADVKTSISNVSDALNSILDTIQSIIQQIFKG